MDKSILKGASRENCLNLFIWRDITIEFCCTEKLGMTYVNLFMAAHNEYIYLKLLLRTCTCIIASVK